MILKYTFTKFYKNGTFEPKLTNSPALEKTKKNEIECKLRVTTDIWYIYNIVNILFNISVSWKMFFKTQY